MYIYILKNYSIRLFFLQFAATHKKINEIISYEQEAQQSEPIDQLPCINNARPPTLTYSQLSLRLPHSSPYSVHRL